MTDYPYNLSGWRKSPRDERDLLRLAPKRWEELPAEVDLSGALSGIYDQDGLGECTGFGIMGSIETQARKDVDPSAERLSPDWGYAGARKLEGTLNEDSGAYSRDVYRWCLPNGCLPERFHPFDTRLDTTDPLTWPNAGQAKRWKILSYTRCVDGWQGIAAALAAGKIVSYGTPWYQAWMNAGPTTPELEPAPSATTCVGGHQVFLVGYSILRGAFLLVNSWGQGWGARGKAWLPFEALNTAKRDGGYDAFYCDVDPQSWPSPEDPGPGPDPDPQPDDDPDKPETWLSVIAAIIAAGALIAFVLRIVL